MKLQILPARRGVTWVRLGWRVMATEPLALTGLFAFVFMTLSLVSMLPYAGTLLALIALPCVSMVFMLAARLVQEKKSPRLPEIFKIMKAQSAHVKTLLILGLGYALGFVLVLLLTTLVDGGAFAQSYWGGGALTRELLESTDFQAALWLACGLSIPLTFMFWHAPALVFWQGYSPVKSIFFSVVACVRNFWALSVYALVWFALVVLAVLVALMVLSALQIAAAATLLLFPLAIALATAFMSSMYFSYADSFVAQS